MDLLTQEAAETQRNCVIAKVTPGDSSVTELPVPGQQAEPTASTSVLDIERMKGGRHQRMRTEANPSLD